MTKSVREWGFPVGLLLLWLIAMAFTMSALAGMDAAMEVTQVTSLSAPAAAAPAHA
jgi:hypothetical protein